MKTNFAIGVEGIFQVEGSSDYMVAGMLSGTVNKGDKCYIENIGDDVNEPFETEIKEIEVGPNETADTASDCRIVVRVKSAMLSDIKIASVIASEDATLQDKHKIYIVALGDAYVSQRNMELSKEHIDMMSLADLAEVYSLYRWHVAKRMADEKNVVTDEEKTDINNKFNGLVAIICNKIFKADSLYYVFNKTTNQPHLFSQTMRNKDGDFVCTPPSVMMWPKAYKDLMMANYEVGDLEVREVVNGPGKDGILKFLGNVFFIEGADAITFVNENLMIGSKYLVEAPNYDRLTEEQRKLINPNLTKWKLLYEQLGEADTEDKKLIARVYEGLIKKNE